MQCKEGRQQFNAYIDGELTFEEEERLEGHFKACVGCREEYRRLGATVQWLQGLPMDDPGEDFSRTVMRRLGEKPASADRFVPLGERVARWLGVWMHPKPAIAMAMVLLFGVFTGVGLNEIAGGREGGETGAVIQAERTMPDEHASPSTPTDPEVGSEPVLNTVSTIDDAPTDPSVEFVLQPYVLRGGPEQMAEPLFPTARQVTSEGSRDGAYITY
jgi:hypothetical protein